VNSNHLFALCMCAKRQNRVFQAITFSKALVDKLVEKEIKRVPTCTTTSAIPIQNIDKSKLLFFLPAVLRHNNNNDNDNYTVIIKIGNCGCHLLRSRDINNCKNPFSPPCPQHTRMSTVLNHQKHQQSHFTVITV